jgi:RHS repeat-associated protein
MGYDDLGRLLSDNCGSVWAQTFSYDQYDNLTKAGSSTWNPGYNSANNHYNIGSYDNSGNILNDTFHTYAWGPYNKMSSIDSSACGTNGECVTYDALGRIVETSAGGVNTELWYTQMGKTVYMHGATPSYAYWPTPGGGTVEINGNNATAYYMHKDWLGNSRISSTIVNHTVVSDQAYAPYGEVYNKATTGAGVPGQMFTGDTQDILSGLFDTPNRELSASQGRWLSPDPAGAGWNLYAYGTNPNSAIDPSGLKTKPPNEFISALIVSSFGTMTIDGLDGFAGMCPVGACVANATVPANNISTGNAGAANGTTGDGSDGVNRILSGISDFTASLSQTLQAGLFQFEDSYEEKPDAENLEPINPLEPLEPGDFAGPPWAFNLMNPGPLQPDIAKAFAGGQYSLMTVGGEGWGFDGLYRVFGGASGETGQNGTFYSPLPQVGGLQSQIDLGLRPEWGNTATNVVCVYLAPGTQVFVGPIAAQGGYSTLVPGSGQSLGGIGLQIYLPPQP